MEKTLSYADACSNAIKTSMRRDENVLVYGLGVDDPKGMYGTTLGLVEEFGSERCFDTPLSEDSMTGMGIGLAMSGYRPIHVHQRFDFLLLCMNQLINMASKVKYLSNGNMNCPLVVRAIIGRSWGQGAQHSQSFHSFFSSIPGLTVVAPVTPFDMYNTLIWSLKQNNPIIFVEHRMLYKNKGIVYEEPGYIPGIRYLKRGSEITICSFLHSSIETNKALSGLPLLSADHININNLNNIDFNEIFKSVKKTNKLLVIDNGWIKSSIATHIVSTLAILGFKGKIGIMGYENCPCPTPKIMENSFYPTSQKIAKKICELVEIDFNYKIQADFDIESFKGPF